MMCSPNLWKEVTIDTYNTLGVNCADNGIKLHHIPTGITINVDEFRSQHKNRDKAVKRLMQRLEGFLPIYNKESI